MKKNLKFSNKDLPTISVILPTYNAEKYLKRCLDSIKMQDYPKEKLEIIVIDGGSRDRTLEIAKRYETKILFNPFRDCDEGKSIGIHNSRREIIALIDADNELDSPQWFRKMTKPLLEDKSIFGVESKWLIKHDDPLINRYVTLLQITDPLARRFHPKMEISDRGDYVVYRAKFGDTPVIGANGFLWRRSVIDTIGGYENKFEEVNFIARLIEGGYLSYAKPKNVGTYHYYCTSVFGYISKRLKTGRKFLARKAQRRKTWVDYAEKENFWLGVLYNVSIIGPLFETINEIKKSKNAVWLWHPFISWLTIVVYSYSVLEHYARRGIKKIK